MDEDDVKDSRVGVAERSVDAPNRPARFDPAVPLRDRLALLSAQFAWDGKSLAVTDTEVLNRLVNRVMSASTMNSLEGCPSRWAFEKLWPGDPDPFAAAPVGNGAHKVLEMLYALPPQQRTMDAAMMIARFVATEQMSGEEPLTVAVRDRWMAEVYAAFKGVFVIEDPTQVVVEGRELEVEAKIGGVGFIGHIDRLDRNGDGGLTVLDYKTSAKLPKDLTKFGDPHGDQQRLYLMALHEIRGELPDAAYLHYTRLGQSKKVAQAKGRLAETRDRFVLSSERLALIGEKATLPTAPSPLCGWCPLVNVCPAAKKEGKTDRTDHAVEATWLPIPTIGSPAKTTAWPVGTPTVDDETAAFEADMDTWARERAAAAEPAAAAHNHEETAEPPTRPDSSAEGATAVTTTRTRLKEGLPYVEQADGDLNPASYASMAVNDVVETAVYVLDKASVPLTKAGVESLSAMLASIVLDVQRAVTGDRSWQEGMNSRARFLVKRVMRALGPPVHGDAQAWEEWADKVTHRAGLMWRVAYGLWSDGVDDEADLAGDLARAIAEAKSRRAGHTSPGPVEPSDGQPGQTPSGAQVAYDDHDVDDVAEGSGFDDFPL